ncbi:hypothetical protein Tco_0794516 [Tanacetum coccineum]
MGSKSRLYSSRRPSKSSSKIILSILVICSFLVLSLLAFVIISIPKGSSDDAPNVHEINSIVHHTSVIESSDDRGDQWVEVISWEPRAVVYHNFLVSISFYSVNAD